MGIFQKLFGRRTSKEHPLGSAKLGSGAEVRFTYKEGGTGKRDYASCHNCGFKGGFSAVWTCRECGVTFCTQCLSEDDRCPKCNRRNFVQSGLIDVA
ncbi:MAG: hypothetical protein V1897_01855 [Pseudomonadota bacterium]